MSSLKQIFKKLNIVVFLMLLSLHIVGCGSKGMMQISGDSGTVNPPTTDGVMSIQTGVFLSGTQAESSNHTMTSYVTPYDLTTMESHRYTALSVNIQTVND